MSNELKIFLFGVFVGTLSFAIILMVTPNSARLAKDAIDECQKELPRNQRCGITAKPIIQK